MRALQFRGIVVVMRHEDDEGALPVEAGQTSTGRWTRERVARLAFLAGLGWTAKRIAADPLVRTNPGNVYKVASRYGIAFADAPRGKIVLRLPADTLAIVERAGACAGLTPAALLRRLAIAEARLPRPFASAMAG